MADAPVYDLKTIKLPYFSGLLLRHFVSVLESPLSRLVIPQLMDNAGITAFRELRIDDDPVVHPLAHVGSYQSLSNANDDAKIQVDDISPIQSSSGFQFRTVHEFSSAYRKGITTPTQIAGKLIDVIEQSNHDSPPLNAVITSYADDIMEQAAASSDRHSRGQPLSPFDGVPVLIKDEFDMVPYPTSVGTKFLGNQPAMKDATVVARLRAAGALLFGKGNMHEVGIGVTGHNAHFGTPRNPYNPQHYTGGSSSGPSAAVASGLCPVAIGADGGGSIRIPAAFCGLVGLKPTFGRVSEFGAAPLTWSMAHIGPICTTVADTALTYAVIAGPDSKDRLSWHQPAPNFTGWEEGDLKGVTLGVYWPWFRHASNEIVQVCETTLHNLESMGASIKEIEIPDLEAARVAHLVTIAGEIAQSMQQYYHQHRKDFSLEVRTNLVLAKSFTASDFILSQRVRGRTISNLNRIFSEVDIIVTPSTGLPSPAIAESALPDGDSDLTTLIEIMRFATIANLTGLPAISFPVGYTSDGLPIGMQGMSRAWDEVSLFRLAAAAERIVERKKPQLYFDLLAG